MKKELVAFLIATQCSPDMEEEFTKWYNEVHIPMCLESKLLKRVTHYKLALPVEGVTQHKASYTEGDYPKHLVVYEFKDSEEAIAWWNSPERLAAKEERQQRWKGREFEVNWLAIYEPIMSWH